MKTVIECGKRCQNIFIGSKKTCWGVLDRGDRKKYNETGLKEGGVIEMSTTVLPFTITIITSTIVTNSQT